MPARPSFQFQGRSACLVRDAAYSTAGTVLIRRRFGADGLPDRFAAETWAARQEWFPRVVRMGNSAGWWCWFVAPAREK